MDDTEVGQMVEQETGLYVFRKLVYVLYLEIGALQPRIHAEMARKARLKSAFFQREKERQAAEMYRETEHETDLQKIVAPYVERTGLTLEDIHRAFAEGDWRNKFGAYTFGGPKWEHIADLALQLRQALEQGQDEAVTRLVQEVKGLKTNQGYLINQFERSERRR
jgi:hypothetical protein